MHQIFVVLTNAECCQDFFDPAAVSHYPDVTPRALVRNTALLGRFSHVVCLSRACLGKSSYFKGIALTIRKGLCFVFWQAILSPPSEQYVQARRCALLKFRSFQPNLI